MNGGFQEIFNGGASATIISSITFSGTTSVNWNQLTSGLTASGALTVSDMTHTANITLLGQYVAGSFHITSDGTGGTLAPTRRSRRPIRTSSRRRTRIREQIALP